MTTVRINGVDYPVEYWPRAKMPKGQWGFCLSPDHRDGPLIVVQKGLCQRSELEWTLHEMRHAENFELFSEEYVRRVTHESANALIKLGWGKVQ